MYIANDPDQNLDAAREVVRNLKAARQKSGVGPSDFDSWHDAVSTPLGASFRLELP